jgi:hypothetical protein
MTTNLKFIRRFALSFACLSLACVGDASAQVQDRAFQFGFVGDRIGDHATPCSRRVLRCREALG